MIAPTRAATIAPSKTRYFRRSLTGRKRVAALLAELRPI
jgi:hypothetical protein